MQKCVACQFYDRNDAQSEDKGVRWGKCRRTGPIVHPLSAKAYMVEGVWPQVRDDDWCGEWALGNRRPDSVATVAMNSLLMQTASSAARPASPPAFASSPAFASPEPDPIHPPMATLMRGDLRSD